MSAEASIPGSPVQQFEMMLRRLLGSRQWDRALEAARDWLSQDPENIEAHLGAAQALVNLHKYPAAETHIAKVLAARPNNSFAFRLASIVFFHQHKSGKAEEYIQRAIELQPNDPNNWYQLALMRFRQNLFPAAEQHARRALELQPDNANTINLIAICQRGNPRGQYEQYLKALEIDPENGVVHTNLGGYYLNTTRDYPAAEASFRRALQLDPTNELAQKNLFAVLRLRDPLYRVLTWPRTLLRGASWARRDRGMAVRIALLLLWLALGRYILVLIAVWLMLLLPLVKVYEYLTLSDIRAAAGVVGARRGGWAGFHRWPLAARLGIFAFLVLCFWGGLFWLYEGGILPAEWIIGAAGLTLLAWYVVMLSGWWKRSRTRAAAKRAEKKFHKKARAAQQDQRQRPAAPDPY
jgi:tetratricopeptide (TPR) repeat protein